MLYNNPVTTNVDMSAKLVARLTRALDNVRYIKEASMDVGRVYDVIEATEGVMNVFAGERPVLLMPGRIDAALALWLLIGRRLVAKLAGGGVADTPTIMPLKRKATSTIGMTELIPVSCADGMAEPLGSGYLPFTALARSDGWIVVPADSEGFAAGAQVAVTLWS